MRKLWLTLFATVLLVGGVGMASAQMHGGGGGGWHGGGGGGWHGGGGGWHGGHFHDGRFHHFHHFHTHFSVFLGAPFFWLGAPYYPYYYPYSYYDGSYAWPVYGNPGPTTYIQQDSGAATESGASQTGGGEYRYYCTDPAGYYPQIQNCAKVWLKVVPDGSPTPR